MFFKQTVLKRMLKEAYKGGGLIVGHVAGNEVVPGTEGYYISSGWWVMWFAADRMPKEAKAAIIELCGDLPEEGEAFKARKDEANQYEIEWSEVYDLPKSFEKSRYRFRVTKILERDGDKLIRFIQEEETQHVTAIKELFIDLIDTQSIDYDGGEHKPYGPVAISPTSHLVYWGNNTCYLMAGIYDTYQDDGEEKEFRKHLEEIKVL